MYAPAMEWLNYHHLLYVWVVARDGSVPRAAAELQLGQPTIDAQLHHPLLRRGAVGLDAARHVGGGAGRNRRPQADLRRHRAPVRPRHGGPHEAPNRRRITQQTRTGRVLTHDAFFRTAEIQVDHRDAEVRQSSGRLADHVGVAVPQLDAERSRLVRHASEPGRRGVPAHTPQPFCFSTSLSLTLLTTRRARDLAELLAHLRAVPGSVIYFHTHHFLAQHQYLSPEPPNDFAYWVTNALQEDRLGEQLAAIDLIEFRTIRALRDRIIAVIEGYLDERQQLRTAPEGEEFHFREAVSFIVPTSHVAHTLAEFAACMEQIGFGSLSLHFFDARLRLETGDNDFSVWLASALGEEALGRAIAGLDPYTYTLDGLRKEVVRLVRQRLAEDPT